MDPRQQNQDFPGNNAQRVGTNYSFNGAQNDAFSTFVNTDNDNAFDPPWNSQAFPSNQQPVNGFDQGNHGWQQHPYQSPNLLSMNNYGIQPRDYEQPFSRSPAPFDYSGFDSTHTQTFSPSAYDASLNFGQLPLSNNPQYDYAGQQGLQQQQHHDTISPQALQNYSTSFTQSTPEDSRQVSTTLRLAFLPYVFSPVLTTCSLKTCTMAQPCLCEEPQTLKRFLSINRIGLPSHLRCLNQLLQKACILNLL